MATIHEPARETPVIDERDVVVVGGGPAGIGAAVSAAREGGNVLLIDEHGYLGGMMTGGLMPSMNGFRNQIAPNDVQTIKGLAQEIVDRLIDMNGIAPHCHYNFVVAEKGISSNAVPFDPEIMKMLLLNLVTEAGVHLLLHTYAVAPIMDGKVAKGVIIQNKAGRQAILAKVVIDTADGDMAAAAGAPYEKLPHGPDTDTFRMTMMYRLANVHPERWGDMNAHGILIHDSFVSWGGNVYRDGVDPSQLTTSELEARDGTHKAAEEMIKLPGMEGSWLMQTAESVGVRETRRFICEHMITDEEAVNDVRFPDVIGISSNPAPLWKGGRFFFPHLGFDLPYRCLVPKEVDNILISGRCVSAEQLAWRSLRNQCGCLTTGQAAGTAAMLSIRQGVTPRNVDIKELQTHLRAQNVVIDRSGR